MEKLRGAGDFLEFLHYVFGSSTPKIPKEQFALILFF
jgi:hypothetical protein